MARVKVRKTKFTIPSKYLLLIMTILCIALMLLTFTTDVVTGPLEAVSGYVIIPFQDGISEVGMFLTSRKDNIKKMNELMEENTSLQEQVDSLSIENSMLQQDKYELSRLRELYLLDEQYSDYEKIGARVIGMDPGNWFSVFLINKGTNDGISVNCNIMSGSGLVGRVVDVGPNWATVKSIIDDSSNVSAMVLSTSDRLIVSGDLETMNDVIIRFEQLIDEDNRVAEGDQLVTSQISDIYLPGLTIGYISEIKSDPNNLTKSGYLTPSVDFKRLDTVLVILDLKQTVSE